MDGVSPQRKPGSTAGPPSKGRIKVDANDLWEAWGVEDPLWANLAESSKSGGAWDIEKFLQTGRVEIDDVMSKLRSLNSTLERKSAMDYGCGAGRLTQALSRYFESVTGADVSASMILAAQKINRCDSSCSYRQVSGLDLSEFADDSFDFVYSSLVLIHLRPNLSMKLIREFIRVVRPGGVVVFHCMGGPKSQLLGNLPGIDRILNRSQIGPRVYTGLYACWRKIQGLPVGGWEMHWLGKPEVSLQIANAGGRLLCAEQLVDDGILSSWRYYAAKQISSSESN